MTVDAERKRGERPRCLAIVQPDEYTIDRWEGQRCSEKNLWLLMRCSACGAYYCLSLHWRKHLESVPTDHFEKATS